MGNIANVNVSKNDLNAWINEYAAANGVSATVTTDPTDSSLVTVTFTGANDTQSTSLQIRLPEIPPVDGSVNVDSELAELSGTLTQMVNEANGQTTTTTSVSKSSVSQALFSIYDCLKLLMEVEMKQRETQAAARAQQHSNIAASLQAEADSIRAAADISFSYGLACAIINTAMTTVSTVMTMYSTVTTLQEISNSNIGAAKQNLSEVKADLKDAQQAQGAGGTKTAEQLLKDAGLTKDQVMPTAAKLDAKVAAANDTVTTAETVYTEAKGSTLLAEQKVENASNDLAAAKKDLATLTKQTPPATPAEVDTAKAKVTDCETKLTSAKSDLATARDTEAAAKKSYDSAVNDQVSVLKDYKAALETDAANAKTDFDTKYAALNDKQKADVDAAEYKGNEQQVLEARAAKAQAELAGQIKDAENAANAPALIKGLKVELDNAKQAVAVAQRDLLDSPQMLKNRNLEQLAQCLNQFGQALSSLVNVFGEKQSEYARADQKQMEAQQEIERAKLEQTNDLYQQTQQMINSILQLLNAIMEAESQSQQQAINV